MTYTRKAFYCIMAIVLAAGILVGCGGGQSSSQAGGGEVANFSYNTTSIVMGSDIASVVDVIGEPDDIFESPSCAFEGIDKIYYYPGFEIYTYPKDGKDYISSLTITGDDVTTHEGATLGMAKADVEAMYGASSSGEANLLRYTRDDTELTFVLLNDAVVDITYYYLPVQDAIQQAAQ